MPTRTSGRLKALAPFVVLACVLAGCGSGAPDAAEESSTTVAGLGAASETDEGVGSYPLPDCEGQDPATCSYDGFDPAIDGFSFPNWSTTGELDATGMVALFGEDEVCAKSTNSGCVLYPAARKWAEQMNEAMAGGHCEGMAVMAARLFSGDADIADLDPDAESTYDLQFEDPDVIGAIDMWWTTQMLAPVQAAYSAFQQYQPSEIAVELAAGLQRGDGYTMGIYSDAGAHAITPFAVTVEDGDLAVSVYDNNFPGTVQRIMIDPVAERWSYAMGSTNPDAPTDGWEGGLGTIELTPMDSRELPAPAPFDDSPTDDVARGNAATSHLLITSPDPDTRVGITLEIDGQTYDTTDPSVVLPEGVLARSTLGAALSGKGMAIAVDRSQVKSFSASPKSLGDPSSETAITMSIDAVDRPRVTMRAKADDAGAGKTSFTVNRRGALAIAAADGSDPEVNVANGLNSVDFALPDGIDMTVDQNIGDGISEIEYIDEDGNVIGAFAVDDETESGEVVDGTADFDAESGEFDVTEEFAEAEAVDEDVLVWLAEDVDGDSGSESADDEDFSGDEGDEGGADEGDAGDEGGDESEADDGSADESGNDGGADDGGADEGGADEGGAGEGGADDAGADDAGADEGGADDAGADEGGADEEEDPDA